MKKTAIFAVVLAGLLLLGSGTAFALGRAAQGDIISQQEAIDAACADAGVTVEDVRLLSTEFDREDGRFVYEIEFYADGVEYDYYVDAANGEILKREMEGRPSGGASKVTIPGKSSTKALPENVISPEEARAAALESAELTEDEVFFSKTKLELEHRHWIYDIVFYDELGCEYKYEIDAQDGRILSLEYDAWDAVLSGSLSA